MDQSQINRTARNIFLAAVRDEQYLSLNHELCIAMERGEWHLIDQLAHQVASHRADLLQDALNKVPSRYRRRVSDQLNILRAASHDRYETLGVA